MKARRSPQRSSDVRENLQNFVDRLSERAKQSAADPSISQSDKRILRDDAALLVRSVKSLIRVIDKHDALLMWSAEVTQAARPDDEAMQSALGRLGVSEPAVANGMVDLSSALWAALNLADFVLDNPIMARTAKKLRAANTAHARQALEPKSKEIGDLIVELSGPVLKRNQNGRPTLLPPRSAIY